MSLLHLVLRGGEIKSKIIIPMSTSLLESLWLRDNSPFVTNLEKFNTTSVANNFSIFGNLGTILSADEECSTFLQLLNLLNNYGFYPFDGFKRYKVLVPTNAAFAASSTAQSLLNNINNKLATFQLYAALVDLQTLNTIVSNHFVEISQSVPAGVTELSSVQLSDGNIVVSISSVILS